MPRSAYRRRSHALLVVGVLVGLPFGMLTPGAVQAEPPSPGPGDTAWPSTAMDAKQAWLDSSERAALVNDEVLQAQEREQRARADAEGAAREVRRADSAAAAANLASTRAATASAVLQLEAQEFAGATFRGARLSKMAALLTSASPDDFLDQAMMLDQVAADVRSKLDDAAAAEQRARRAALDASNAVAGARDAKTVADATVAAAARATAQVHQRQAALRAEVTKYRDLTERLTEKERQEAMAAQQRAFERQAQQRAAAAATTIEAEPDAAPSAAPSDPTASAPTRDAQTRASPGDRAPAASAAGQAAVRAALSKLGSRYVWGAAGPSEFDCSGLTSWAWAQAGVTIPRTSRGQSGLTPVPLDQLRPGDLVTYYSPVSHVAMYIGDGKVVQASTETKPVYVGSLYGAGPNPTGHRVSA